jgi:glycosyltransferase involved in cell wall biosynthesis
VFRPRELSVTKKVTVLTATTGRRDLLRCVRSVRAQSYRNIEHLVFTDGPAAQANLESLCADAAGEGQRLLSSAEERGYQLLTLNIPKSVGRDRWNGHRIYAAGTYLADGDYVCFLDDDNYFEPDHVESLVEVIEKDARAWAFALRYIIDAEGRRIGEDNCESLGKWASVIHPSDYFIDVNCFLLPTRVAVAVSPAWYRKAREPGQPEVDRLLTHLLRTGWGNYETNYRYSVAYAVGSSSLSVQPEFFARGNAEMLRRYAGALPWVKGAPIRAA